MEQRTIQNKYRNTGYYESKYISNKNKPQQEFELINEKKFDYVIKLPSNNKNKDITNGSRNNEYVNEKNNHLNNEEYNNGGNLSLNQNYNNDNYHTNNNNNVINSRNNLVKFSSFNSVLKNDPKKFSKLAKTLKYLSNKDNSHINLIYENDSGVGIKYKINKSDIKKDHSNEKNIIKSDNKSYQINVNKTNIRNFDIQTNYNKKKINSIVPAPQARKNINKIWSNINKDLVPTKEDLKFGINNEEKKNKTPLRINERYKRKNYTENDNKINGGENNLIDKENEYISNFTIQDREKEKEDIDKNNNNVLSYKIRIKDSKEIIKQKSQNKNQKNNINNSNNNIKVSYEQGRRSNKNIKDPHINKVIDNNNQNKNKILSKNDSNNNIYNLKSNKSSPNILTDYNNNTNNKLTNSKSPKMLKDLSDINVINSNNGKNITENKFSPRNIKNHMHEISVKNNKNDKADDNPVQKIYIDMNKMKNKNDKNSISENKMKERIHELKQIMNYNRKNVNYLNDNSNDENGIKIANNNKNRIQIDKNPCYYQHKNENIKIIFHKKLSRSPAGLIKKPNITNDNINSDDNKENNNSISKINYRINKDNNVISLKQSNKNKNNNKINTEKSNEKSNTQKKESQISSNISKDSSISNGNTHNNGSVYIRQKAFKKKPMQIPISKDKIENKKVSEIISERNEQINEKNDIYDIDVIDNIDNYQYEKLKEKINLKYQRIKKYYNFYLHPPKVLICEYNKAIFKILQIPKIDVCHISKINLELYILYKNKNICYISKARQRTKIITKPPVNDTCEFSKNIILNITKDDDNKINNIENKEENKNKTETKTSKKNKRRKKRRKGKKSNKESLPEKNNNDINKTESKKENTDITSKDISKEENESNNNNNINNNNNELIPESNIDNINNINNELKSNITEENQIQITSNKNTQEEKSVFSESTLKKKLSPTSYNDEDFNDEENDDFHLASDDDYLSEDKFKKKEEYKNTLFEKGKTEGKVINEDTEINENNIKYKEGLKLLEKWNDKRIMNENDNLNELHYEDMEESDVYNNINNDNNNELNKNIILGADKLNSIFNNQKNNKLTSEDEDDNDDINNYDDILLTDNNSNINYFKKENNLFIDNKKNNTYKNKYEKIGSIFDKLEEIFDKKKEKKNILDSDLTKCKTPTLNKDFEKGHSKNKISDFDLKDEDYMVNNDSDVIKSNHKYPDRENTYNKNKIDMNKYQEIFNNQQQIISKLESLMNKQKNKSKINQDINNNNFSDNNKDNLIFNSPKIESEIDSDLNINKDTPGNRKEIQRNYPLLQIQYNSNINNKKIYSIEEIFSLRNKIFCLNHSLLPVTVINHCDSISKTLKEEYSAFKGNYKEININKDLYSINNIKKLSMDKWARKDMTKEIEKAEKYVKELNDKMSKNNFKHEIIEILNTLTVDNYKDILNSLFIMIFLEENNNKENKDNINISFRNYNLNKPEYLLHNQFIFVEIILEKAIIEKGYVVLYSKLCADLFIEFIKYIKENNTDKEIENQLINGENLKTILTSECRQKFDECISNESLYKNNTNKNMSIEEKQEIYLTFKKKFLGNMDFIAELINVKLLSQTKGFEFLDILYKRYVEIQDEQIKYLNLEGAVTLLAKFGRIVYERKNPKHIQNLDNYMEDNICPIITNNKNNSGLPNYLKFKIINLIEKKKNNWKDSLYEQSIIAKGKNNHNLSNISIYHEHDNASNINIDESLMDNKNTNINLNSANTLNSDINLEKEDDIIIMIKNDIDNYVSYLNEHEIFSLKDLLKNENSNYINNEYDWSMTEELIIKEKNDLEEIIRCYIEVCIDYVQKEQNIFYCNEYIKNIINYYSADLSQEQSDKVRKSMIDLFTNIEDICIDNFLMFEIMGYLILLLLENDLFLTEDLDIFVNKDKNKIEKIIKVVKNTMKYYSGNKKQEFCEKLKNVKLLENNQNLLEK